MRWLLYGTFYLVCKANHIFSCIFFLEFFLNFFSWFFFCKFFCKFFFLQGKHFVSHIFFQFSKNVNRFVSIICNKSVFFDLSYFTIWLVCFVFLILYCDCGMISFEFSNGWFHEYIVKVDAPFHLRRMVLGILISRLSNQTTA